MRTSALFGANSGFFEIYGVSARVRTTVWGAIFRGFVWTSFMDGPLFKMAIKPNLQLRTRLLNCRKNFFAHFTKILN